MQAGETSQTPCSARAHIMIKLNMKIRGSRLYAVLRPAQHEQRHEGDVELAGRLGGAWRGRKGGKEHCQNHVLIACLMALRCRPVTTSGPCRVAPVHTPHVKALPMKLVDWLSNGQQHRIQHRHHCHNCTPHVANLVLGNAENQHMRQSAPARSASPAASLCAACSSSRPLRSLALRRHDSAAARRPAASASSPSCRHLAGAFSCSAMACEECAAAHVSRCVQAGALLD